MDQGSNRPIRHVVHISQGMYGVLAKIYRKMKLYQAEQAGQPEDPTLEPRQEGRADRKSVV